ncbi:transcription termination/antitermination protein NusG [Candidatus Haliotispira prima]|uniref:Transcription termination/antitermination protein NusG n=1 Tax=Candidatus Haliotispira prima TaxID=3034016 RepID=A0ABY8MIM1_9SPIO|nr:transcription termination/antitermination protein NusG [Candidatus Haliotispira prima]
MMMGWYVLQALTSQENKVEKYIQNIIESGKFEGILNAVKVPSEVVVEVRNGKKRNVTKKFLPGYVLVEMELPQEKWQAVCSELRSLQGVVGFVGYGKQVRPQPISKEEARSILQRSGDIKSDVKFQVRQDHTIGEEVKIISGPFETFTGRVDEILAEQNKLKVMVAIFGRDTPVELSLDEVERMV